MRCDALGHDARVTRRQLRLAATVAAGLIIGLGVANLYWSVAQWTLSDAGAYWRKSKP